MLDRGWRQPRVRMLAAVALAGGLLLARAVMGVRIVALAAVLYAPLVAPLLLPFGAITAVTLGAASLFLRRARGEEPAPAGPVVLKNPFSLTAAVSFGVLFAVVLLVVAGVECYFPGQGYYVVAALAGLTDVDAITLSMAGVARSGNFILDSIKVHDLFSKITSLAACD